MVKKQPNKDECEEELWECTCGDNACQMCDPEYKKKRRDEWERMKKWGTRDPDFSEPATMQSWIVGVLSGGHAGWMQDYIESK